eukprot:TRINITY_DN3507_c0_g1_i2.p1 TRINITY_DN3507_c0_g1~~TRINITY_DN3507_c0_g1_i2.p1  ORF type:complete len:206 (-),score=34.99 TRINITY_DN3507_c0_g1_i2:69-686(-)
MLTLVPIPLIATAVSHYFYEKHYWTDVSKIRFRYLRFLGFAMTGCTVSFYTAVGISELTLKRLIAHESPIAYDLRIACEKSGRFPGLLEKYPSPSQEKIDSLKKKLRDAVQAEKQVLEHAHESVFDAEEERERSRREFEETHGTSSSSSSASSTSTSHGVHWEERSRSRETRDGDGDDGYDSPDPRIVTTKEERLRRLREIRNRG